MYSMRSIGYSFKTAVADIVDNSISAKASNVKIYVPINNDRIYIAFLDDGEGMSEDELLNAMKYGSNRKYDSEIDLGRFGLGMKSASLSQCRTLTVASKKDGSLSAFRWDLDYVQKTKQWQCLRLDEKEMEALPKIEELKGQSQGTLVVWTNFDIAYKKSNGHVYELISKEVDEAEKHLRLVFHRFINGHSLSIFINGNKLEGFDPFLENHPKTDTQKPSIIKCEGSDIKVQQFILPHQNDLSNDDIDRMGGIELLRDGQGFYIYRNDRLIIYGTWFRLASNSLSSELYKYGRIKVDIPNTLDELWDIDIKKQNATIPMQILSSLRKAVSNVRNRSKGKNDKRVRLKLEKDDSKIWNKDSNRDGKEHFFINCESDFIKTFLDEFSDNDKSKIIRFLDVISSSLPCDDIYNSICNRKIEREISMENLDSIIVEGINQFHYLKRLLHKSDEETFEILRTYEPFSSEEVIDAIKERLPHAD